jgi:lambda family phage minor tail protein L
VNDSYDPDSYIKDVFKITELTALNEQVAEFTLTNWLQYFKLQLPKRKYYKNTCQWQYKGAECQYPGPNGGTIPGTYPALQANTNPITMTNEVGASDSDDECAKSYTACKLRNNTVHFGGFIGTGRSIAR